MTSRPRVLRSTIATILVSAVPFFAPAPAHADLTWDPGHTTDTWAVGGTTNWLGSELIPVAWADGELAIFSGTPAETVTINGTNGVGPSGLRFDLGGYTIAGTGTNGTLNIGAGGITVTNAEDLATISAPVSGTVGLTRSGAGILALTGVNSFSGGLILNGGTTRLTGANTFSGGITLNAGATLQLSSGGADNTAYNNFLGAAANGLTFNGGTLLANAATTGSVDRTLTNRAISVQAGGATLDVPGAVTDFVEGVFNQVRFSGTTLTGSGTLTKNGGGRVTFTSSSGSGFSGPVVMNGGTMETAGSVLGNASATNTITINGGNLALTGNVAQKVTLNGGALSPNGADRTVTGTVGVTAGSYIFTNDFFRDSDGTNNIARRVLISGKLSGTEGLGVAVNRTNYRSNSGALVLQNATNDYSGTITVGKNLRLENNATGGTGKTLGTAAIVLADGGLTLRDNGAASDTTLDYGNNVSVIAPTGIFNRGTLEGSAFIDANRASGSNTGNTFKLGSLTLGRSLTIMGGNGYGVEFSDPSQLTGNATLNVTTAPLAFRSNLTEDAPDRTLTKAGLGSLTFYANASHTGGTLINGGSVILDSAGGRLSGTTVIEISNGGSLQIDNTGGNIANRVIDSAPIRMENGALVFSSEAGTAVTGAETVGPITLVNGANSITVIRSNPNAPSVLTTPSLDRQNDATVNFSGTNFGMPGNSSRFVITGKTADDEFLGSWITVNNEFARYVASSDVHGVLGITAVEGLTDPVNDLDFSATTNLRILTNPTTTLTANRSLNTVAFINTTDNATLDLGVHTLKLEGGGIAVGTNTAAITATTGNLTSGTPELIITNNAALNIAAAIVNDGANPISLRKTGGNTLTLSGQNTFTGDTVVEEGALAVGDVSDAGVPGHLGAGSTLRLSAADVPTTLQFTGATDSTNRALVIGTPGATVNVTNSAAVLSWNGNVTGGDLTVTGPGSLALNASTTVNSITTGTGAKLTLGGTVITNSVAVTAGSTLSAGGNVIITGDLDVGNGTNGTLTGLTGGTLSVGSGSSNSINIGAETNGTSSATTGTANLASMESFNANVGIIRVGVEGPGAIGSGSNTGTLILPADSAIVATNSIVVGDSAGDGGGGSVRARLTFGSGINSVITPLLTIGGRKYSAEANIAPGGILTLGSTAARTTLNVGFNNIDTGTTPVTSFDLSGGTFEASLSSLTVGYKSSGGAIGKSSATLNLGTSAATDVSISTTSGSAVRVGILDYTGGTQPTDEQANGTLIIGGGNVAISSTVATSSAVVIGNFSNPSTTITGATATNSASGTLTIDGGNVTITSAGTSNAINLGARSVAGTPAGTNTSSGTLNINGGSLTVNNQITGNSGNAASTSTVNITGGTLNMQGKNLSNINNLTFSGGTIRNLGTLNRALTQTGEGSLLDVVANNTTISGAYSVTDGDVNVAATRTLNATGGTTLNGTATLTVNGSLSGSLTVNPGATVTGSGTTQALNLAGGILAPGNSPGILKTGNLSLNGGTLSLELGGTNPGLDYDQINVTGTLSLTSNTSFTLALGFTPSISDSFVLISNDGTDTIAGAGRLVFGGVTLIEGAIFDAGGSSFRITYAGGSSNNDIVLQTVPEPSTAVALFGGIGTLLGLQRFRRRGAK